jgi:YHS domain-containing protein
MEGPIRATCLIAALGLMLAGCAKKEQTTPPPARAPSPAAPAKEQAAQQTAEQAPQQAQQAAVKVTQQVVQEANQVKTTAQQVAAEQTVCPVMKGQPIDKAIFVEYKGKKVYFCCQSCKAAFEKEPEKYVKDLPQFKQ